jgi:hypothetical protein
LFLGLLAGERQAHTIKARLVSGHGFSRANYAFLKEWALAPEGCDYRDGPPIADLIRQAIAPYSSLSIFPNVGRCFVVFSFFFTGPARVIGTTPITLRDSAFTAVTARNGFFFPFLAAMVSSECQKTIRLQRVYWD